MPFIQKIEMMIKNEMIQHLKYDAEQGKKMWRQEREDNAVRALNPAVEKAYRNYQLLLELARK